ncbi:MAG TPA: 1-(5-phosphoribosyl)-5-[(5-phosphoribosylamino)methylideneamino]imidazole-4-carboxamide isomerase [Dehalococcoidia bacterium]|mgnify:FL=1|jgi:phosphoribosylformimino-5-aminoimidazole carboxamide ribotide isomerase|nr:1-(5-phosphoribosyl)-5-[(5-phosphoribosylamino)methylideneamino]imidazole-4-carboxamide isomerase [Chloroflexota bacterium]MDP5876778.1 1-(5-phosphoribosyl)-5-[(5-phosphoribosylamino)methylideneamino]imidazole-4-carboxamide isomerase [Dehalococcoidia bacterium]MDP6273595.1 1-(5-phosphoribosyl)-5-[(5-phosphoribosylamino)methylideneamino]imidazole-4-carboxamide isomerase [Dehalococcoidia bacterium]MDP7160127.1 1-(5-phosphoribosyl)-5-[(5-phosphoribosylamino)methylideneamino]imidazole-4-carboxami|tara:strand:- start:2138 stop:2863 length:726 start_codon:yes stop_codon:yes gene_type:complete
MDVIPAIDLHGGKCVRLHQGDYSRETVFDVDPLAVLRRFEAAGATRVNVVDLDGARDGIRSNAGVVADMAATATIPLQISGGIRDAETAAALVKDGVARVVFGTAAVEAPDEVESAIGELGTERVVVGIDARDGVVATRGWMAASDVRVLDMVRKMADMGVSRIQYTDINRDATMAHPNFEAAAELLDNTTCRILIAGGISSIEDLLRLKELGVDGAVLGQAIYTGAIDLAEAVSTIKAHS